MSRDAVIAASGEAVVANGKSFAMREWAHGPNVGPPMHIHHDDDEAWHVIEGALRFQFADRSVDVAAGATVFVPAGVAHTFGNPGPATARYLVVTTAQVLALIEALHKAEASDDAAIAAMYRQYRAELLA